MNWPASIGLSMLSAFGGGLLGLGIGLACVSWYAITSFEGKSGYMVGLFILIGVVAGLIIGLVAARMPAEAGDLNFAAGSMRAVIGLLGCGAVVLAIAWLLAPPADEGTDAVQPEVIEVPEPDPATQLPAVDAPLAEWLGVLRYNGNPEIVQQVVTHVAATPDLGTQLGALFTGDNDDAAHGGFLALSMLPADAVIDRAALMQTAAEDLGSRIEAAASLSLDADPGYAAASSAYVRFVGWITMYRSLPKDAQVPLQPLLLQMKADAAKRPDSQSLQEIVRIAGHYVPADADVTTR